jgi:hypothetical protein
MLTIPIYYLVIGGVILLWLVFKLFEYKSKIAKPEQVYVDTSGISENPPKFIEVLQNKTINFLIGDHKIAITQLSIGSGLTIVGKIAYLYQQLIQAIEIIPESRVQEVKNNIYKDALFKQIVKEIYRLSKPFAKSKRKYKKALFAESKKNLEKVLLITEQIFDYWMYIKKLLALLSRGGTMRMTIGEECTWNSFETDTNGNRIIKPRFVLSMN